MEMNGQDAHTFQIISNKYGISMKLIAYTLGNKIPDIQPAPAKRQWMDDTSQSFAYRCLPLNIANSHGWQILCPYDFTAIWNGGIGTDAIAIECSAPDHDRPLSHFGSGILTFHVNVLFRTEAGYNMWVMGPSNGVKDGIVPLNGVVETDWSPYSFTMNWKFTRPNHKISFSRGEPFCQIFPIMRNLVNNCEPEFLPITSDADTHKFYTQWQQSRTKFIADLSDTESAARQEKWQKAYYRGLLPDGQDGCPSHENKLRLQPFKK